MIALAGVAARRSPMTLSNLCASWGPGIHAILGASTDGGSLLLSLLAGAERPARGQIRVLDGDPRGASVRSQIGYVPMFPALLDALRVDDFLGLARRVRGDRRGHDTDGLRQLGIETLASRRIRSLTRSEARAVALAEAISSGRVRVLLVEEPFIELEPRAAHRLVESLREFASSGRAVLIATSSSRDADALADDVWSMRRGCIGDSPMALSIMADAPSDGVALLAVARDCRMLAAALASQDGVQAVTFDGTSLQVRGREVVALAEAFGRAVVATGAAVVDLRIEGVGESPLPMPRLDGTGASSHKSGELA